MLTRADLVGLGFSPAAIKHRVATGRLHPVMRGVYAVGRPDLTREGWWMAAVLACGEGAMLSHGSAAALWGIGKERWGRIDISIRRHGEHRRAGLRVRSRPSLPEEDVTRRNGIPVTCLVRTLLDRATEVGPETLERAVNEADKHDLIDPEALREALEEYAGEPGVRVLRTLLDRRTFRLSDSKLEMHFRPIARAAGLPQPLTKQWVNGFEVDFFWPDLGLVIETDGLRYHRTPFTQSSDNRRDQTHTSTGLTHLRFSHYQIKYKPREVSDTLRRTAAFLPRQAA